MDKNKIKDNIKVPSNLDEYILKGIDEAERFNDEKSKNINNRKTLKVATIIGIVSIGTITTAYAVDKVIDYFELKKNSIYQYEKDNFLEYSKSINLSKKDKGIEFKIDTLAIDDGFFNMTYTITSHKKIADIDESYNRAFVANPMINIIKDGEIVNFSDGGRFENTEATFESEYVLKGILRKPITEIDIKKDTKLTIDFEDIFGVKGDWKIDINLDENVVSSKSKKYIINKSKDIFKLEQYDYDDKTDEVKYKDVKVNYTIDNVVISPFGSLITTTEKSKDLVNEKATNIGSMFVLRDDKGNYLDVIHSIGNFPDKVNKPVSNTFEFVRKSDDIKSLTLIPFVYGAEGSEFSEKVDIDNLPVTFEQSDYGKLTIENFVINEDEISYTYKKEGAVPYVDLVFYDKEGNDISIGGMMEDFVNREDSTHTMRQYLNQKKYKELAKKIKYIAIRKDKGLKLLENQSIEFELKR